MEQYTPLDETRKFIASYVATEDEALDVLALWAASTYAMSELVTHPHLLLTSDKPGSGKTTALMIIKDLSSKGYDPTGTLPSLKSKLAEANGDITIVWDEVSDMFGKSGLNSNNNYFATTLRKSYKRGAMDSRSVNRVAEPFSIFVPFAMTGNGLAAPKDIRERCVHIRMVKRTPREYYDVRESEPRARALGKALGYFVTQNRETIAAFRARGLHPKLVNRDLEVWEPLLAVAYACGGAAWLKRALAAFQVFALSESDKPILTPEQIILRDMVRAADILVKAAPEAIQSVYGADVRDEMRRFDEPLYEGMSDKGLAMAMGDALGSKPEVITRKGRQGRGYNVETIKLVWAARRPDSLEDIDLEVEDDPFAMPSDHEAVRSFEMHLAHKSVNPDNLPLVNAFESSTLPAQMTT